MKSFKNNYLFILTLNIIILQPAPNTGLKRTGAG